MISFKLLFLIAFFIKVAATGWFCVGLAPIIIATSAFLTSDTGAVTAPEPIVSINAATDDA